MSSSAVVLGESIQFNYCACNCGFTRSKYDRDGNERKYILGHANKGSDHPMLGKPRPESTRKKISEAIKGERNYGWKGDNITLRSLHRWVRNNFPPPELCQMCKQKPPADLACITGIYNRDFNNYAYFCRRCHIIFDNVHARSWITRHKNSEGN